MARPGGSTGSARRRSKRAARSRHRRRRDGSASRRVGRPWLASHRALSRGACRRGISRRSASTARRGGRRSRQEYSASARRRRTARPRRRRRPAGRAARETPPPRRPPAPRPRAWSAARRARRPPRHPHAQSRQRRCRRASGTMGGALVLARGRAYARAAYLTFQSSPSGADISPTSHERPAAANSDATFALRALPGRCCVVNAGCLCAGKASQERRRARSVSWEGGAAAAQPQPTAR